MTLFTSCILTSYYIATRIMEIVNLSDTGLSQDECRKAASWMAQAFARARKSKHMSIVKDTTLTDHAQLYSRYTSLDHILRRSSIRVQHRDARKVLVLPLESRRQVGLPYWCPGQWRVAWLSCLF